MIETIDKQLADPDFRNKPRNVDGRLAKMAKKDKPLDKRQTKAVELLAAGLVATAVADSVGITRRQLQTWRKLPAFKQALSEAMDIDAESHAARLQFIYGKAIEKVSELLDDPCPQIRAQAARLAFDAQQNIARVMEEQKMLKSLEERMDALANAGIGGSLPPIQEAEIITEDPISDDET